MRVRALTTFAAAAVRAVFALTLLLATGAQAVVAGGHFERDWAIHAADGRPAALHPVAPSSDDHATEAHVQCAVCRVLAMAGREGPAAPSAPPPHAAAHAAGGLVATAAAELALPILGFQSRAPPV